MFDFASLKDYFLLIVYFVYAVLLPGYLLTRAIVLPRQLKELLRTFPNVEKSLLYRYFCWLFAPAVGLVLIDAVVLVLAKFHQSLSFNNFFISFSAINLVLLIVNIFLVKLAKPKPLVETGHAPSLHRSLIYIFILIFLGSVLVRTVFYLPDAVPQDTDLGHHMYWSQWMVQKETFPVYNTPEVIEGEHMIFAVLSKLSGVTLLSAMPLIVLSFYNLAMILAVFFTAMVVTGNRKIALWALFFSGIYFAIDPPQARYIKGGVIGNTFGNLFIPLVFLLVFLFFRYFHKYLSQSKDVAVLRLYRPVVSLVSLILIIIAGSFYSHHLSTFLLGITLAVSFLVWIVTTLVFCRDGACPVSTGGTMKVLLSFFRRIIFSAKFIITLLMVATFPLYVYLPHYLASNAVETVTQEPEKATHLGITLSDYIGKMGWTRFTLLVLGLIFLIVHLFAYLNKRYQFSSKVSFKSIIHVETGHPPAGRAGAPSLQKAYLILGWFLPLALLSFYPNVFKVDLPSRRVVNYLVFPSVILAAIAANWIFSSFISKIDKKLVPESFRRYLKWTLAILAIIVLWDGTSDFRGVYSGQNKFQDTVELYSASAYLANHTSEDAVILKDHRTVTGDSWIKFFLLRGYDYFLSRTYDYKYNDPNNNLNPCTRETIIVPGSNVSQECYGQTGINYVIVKPAGDEFLFWKNQGFQAIYLNEDIAIFKRIEI